MLRDVESMQNYNLREKHESRLNTKFWIGRSSFKKRQLDNV